MINFLFLASSLSLSLSFYPNSFSLSSSSSSLFVLFLSYLLCHHMFPMLFTKSNIHHQTYNQKNTKQNKWWKLFGIFFLKQMICQTIEFAENKCCIKHKICAKNPMIENKNQTKICVKYNTWKQKKKNNRKTHSKQKSKNQKKNL